MRFVFVVASPEYLRYYDLVLRLLAERGHDVSIAVNHVKEQKQARVEGMEGVRSLGLVPARHDRWSRLATGIRGTADFLRYLDEHDLTLAEAQQSAQDAWVDHVNEVSIGTMFTAASCNSWYNGQNIEGKPRVFLPYVGGLPLYTARCHEVAADGYAGFTLR